MEEFPGNAHKAKVVTTQTKVTTEKIVEEDPKKVEQVTTGDVIRRKKSLPKRFVEQFVGGEGAKGVFAYVVMDVLMPAAKDAVADAVSQGIEKMLFGEARSASRRGGARPTGAGGYTAYNRFTTQPPARQSLREEQRPLSRNARASHDFDEIVLQTRIEADTVIDRMYDLLSRYELVTVKDLYELVNTPSAYTDEKWGWTNLRGAGVTRVRGGYLLDLPRPEPID